MNPYKAKIYLEQGVQGCEGAGAHIRWNQQMSLWKPADMVNESSITLLGRASTQEAQRLTEEEGVLRTSPLIISSDRYLVFPICRRPLLQSVFASLHTLLIQPWN